MNTDKFNQNMIDLVKKRKEKNKGTLLNNLQDDLYEIFISEKYKDITAADFLGTLEIIKFDWICCLSSRDD